MYSILHIVPRTELGHIFFFEGYRCTRLNYDYIFIIFLVLVDSIYNNITTVITTVYISMQEQRDKHRNDMLYFSIITCT